MEKFIQNYKKNICDQVKSIDTFTINSIVNVLDSVEINKANVYVIGNGGSAATASHMENDLGVGLKRRGVMDLKIRSLCDNSSVLTALANDVGYDDIFYSQLENLLSDKDLLIVISCSGDSPNIIKAVKYAKKVGATVLGMSGFGGGELKKLSDISYHIQTENYEYGIVEDLHMMLDHILYTYYIERANNNV